MTCPVPALTTERLGPMGLVPTPGILFVLGFAGLLLSTRKQCLLPWSNKSIHGRQPVDLSCGWMGAEAVLPAAGFRQVLHLHRQLCQRQRGPPCPD